MTWPNPGEAVKQPNEGTKIMATPITDALDAQGTIQPGTEGWWRVWGACINDIRQNDMIMVKPQNGEITEHVVTRIIPEDGMLDAIYLRFIDADGEDIRIGRMCSVIILRRETQHTLSESAH
jgi:hypothetical protein